LLANVVVLIALLSNRQLLKSTTNVYICNQTIIDSLACMSLMIANLLQILGQSVSVPTVDRKLRCLLFDSGNILTTTVYASQAGLVVITIERYFKIVHPIKHHNHFRPWMIKAGVIVPWLNGLVVWFVPNIATVQLINGFCSTVLHKTVAGIGFLTAGFIWQVPIPIVIFIFCYWNIVAAIRRRLTVIQCRPSVDHLPPGTSSATNATRVQGECSVMRQKDSQTSENVIKTMITVIALYTVCWSPGMICNTLYL
jgi:7 transmembrane receptor (rhodopsin family)